MYGNVIFSILSNIFSEILEIDIKYISWLFSCMNAGFSHTLQEYEQNVDLQSTNTKSMFVPGSDFIFSVCSRENI